MPPVIRDRVDQSQKDCGMLNTVLFTRLAVALLWSLEGLMYTDHELGGAGKVAGSHEVEVVDGRLKIFCSPRAAIGVVWPVMGR